MFRGCSRTFSSIGLQVLGVFFAILFAGTPALAACVPNRTNDYKTHKQTAWYLFTGGVNVGGAYSEILLYSPYVYCINPNCSNSSLDFEDNSLAWVGVFQESTKHIAQDVAGSNSKMERIGF